MNKDEMTGKWNQFKGEVKRKWGKLTDNDMTMINGNRDILIGKIQERYGIAREEAEEQVNQWKIESTSESEMPRRKVG